MSIFSNIDPNTSELLKVEERQKILLNLRSLEKNSPFFSPLLFDSNIVGQKNCENLIGQVSIPVGVAGPVSAMIQLQGQTSLLTDLLIPIATTEGALVASINRGCKLLNESKNTKVIIKNIGMTRTPVFTCGDKVQAKELILWIRKNLSTLGKLGETTSHHLTYLDCQIFQKDNLVFTRFSFDTGEAMGMNMVTMATSAISDYIVKNNTGIKCLALSSNVCTDKKTSALNRKLGRGRWVTITCSIPSALITSILRASCDDLIATYRAKIVIGSKLAGLAGHNMQVANVAAGVLTATGQDIAHTVDISQGTLTLNKNKAGIFAKLSLPSVPVGTIGGGTGLEAQTTARNIITKQQVTSDILAAVIGIGCLAGELSGLAALTTNTLASSHKKLGRI